MEAQDLCIKLHFRLNNNLIMGKDQDTWVTFIKHPSLKTNTNKDSSSLRFRMIHNIINLVQDNNLVEMLANILRWLCNLEVHLLHNNFKVEFQETDNLVHT